MAPTDIAPRPRRHSISAPLPECCCGDATNKSQAGLLQRINSKEVFIRIMDWLLLG